MITLFVDASHCPETMAAGWGAWAIQDSWKMGKLFSGRIHQEVLNSSEAEIYGVANAVRYLASRQMIRTSSIMIQCDNLRALQLIMVAIPHAENRPHKNSANIEGVPPLPSLAESKAIEMLAKDLGHLKFVYVRHIKGHSAGTGRNWVNRKCDQLAGEQMRKVRQSLGWGDRKPKFRRDRPI